MALSVGFAPVTAYGVGISTLSITPANVGDVVLLVTSVNSLSITCTGLSSSNATWTASSTVNNDGVHTLQMWKGVVTAASTATVTATWSGSVAALDIELCAFSIHSSTACSWSWGSGGGGTGGTGTTFNFSSITSGSGDLGEAYFGYASVAGTASAGSTSGFTYNVDGNGNLQTYDLALAASTLYTPNGAQSPSGTYGTVAGIIQAVSGTGYTVTFNANGGSGSMSAETDSSPTALTTNTYTRSGYAFTGWNTVSGGSGTAYADGASYPFTASVTLYAQWGSGSVGPSGIPMPTTSPYGWNLIFSDDFTTNATAGTWLGTWDGSMTYTGGPYSSRWWTNPPGWMDTSGAGTYEYSNESVSNSCLTLRFSTVGGVVQVACPQPLLQGPNTEGGGSLYGRYDVCFKTDAGLSGFKTAFLLWPDSEVWNDGEIDFPEGDLGSTYNGFVHQVGPSPSNPATNMLAISTGDNYTDWHVATIEWTATAVTFLVDGTVVGTCTSTGNGGGVPFTSHHWNLQCETDGGAPGSGVAGNLYVDWVAIYSVSSGTGAPGSGAGAVSVTGHAAGAVRVPATASRTVSVTGTAAGSSSSSTVATAAGSVSVVGTAAGVVTIPGTAAGSVGVVGTAAGWRVNPPGAYTGAGLGAVTVTGTAAGVSSSIPPPDYHPPPNVWAEAIFADELQIITVGEVYAGINGQLLATINNITGGTVKIDQTNANRRTCSDILMAIDASTTYLVPGVNSGDLFPDGGELFLQKGIVYPDGTTQLQPLGRFLIETPKVTRAVNGAGSLVIDLSGTDRSGTVARSLFTQPYATDGESTVDVAIMAILNMQVPQLTEFAFAASSLVPPVATYAVGDDPWTACQALAALDSKELFFDQSVNAVCILRDLPDATVAPIAATYNADLSSIITQNTRGLTNVGVPNVIVAQSQGSGVSSPLQAMWFDNNPLSPTYYGVAGPPVPPIGTYPTTVAVITVSGITSLPALQTMANTAGAAQQGRFETCDTYIRDDSARDASDVVTINDPVLNMEANFVLDSLVVQMGYSTAMEIVGRRVY